MDTILNFIEITIVFINVWRDYDADEFIDLYILANDIAKCFMLLF